ncbi:hypothetical protein E4V51_23565 [Paenibacillus sp. 28ISP30-2]|nr:hypothetical protein [Paenibacillus sp. 28ISP30-2]
MIQPYFPLFSHRRGEAGQPEDKDQVLYHIRLETRQVEPIMEFVQQHQLGMPSFIAAIWSVLLSHYANQYTVPLLYSMLSDKEGTRHCQDYPLFIHIQKEDHLLSLMQKIKAKWDKRDSSIKWSEDLSQHMKVDSPSEKDEDFFNVGIVETCGDLSHSSSSTKALASRCGINQPAIAAC